MSFFYHEKARSPANLALLVLRAVVVLQSFAYLSQSLLGETAIFEFLWLTLDLSETAALAGARGGAVAILAASLVLLVRRWRPLGYAIAGWFALSAAAETSMGGAPFYRITLAADAVRFLAPVALVWSPAPSELARGATGRLPWRRVLEIGVGATFIAHGWEALQHHPQFLDYLILTSRRLLDWPLPEARAQLMLTVIGAVDVAIGLIVLAGWRARPVLGYMAVWGLITAFARTVYGGIWAYPATLVRAANAGGPLALLLFTYLPEPADEVATDDTDPRD